MADKPREVTVNMLQANLYSIPIIAIIILVMAGSFLLIWGRVHFLEGFRFARTYMFYLILISGFILHEIVHLIGYHLLGKVPIRFIKIGFQIKTLTPYAYCSKEMPINAYRWSALLPGLILGIIPCFFSLYFGYSTVFILAIVFTIAAGGDLLLIWLLKSVPASALVQDHPTKAGCIILDSI